MLLAAMATASSVRYCVMSYESIQSWKRMGIFFAGSKFPNRWRQWSAPGPALVLFKVKINRFLCAQTIANEISRFFPLLIIYCFILSFFFLLNSSVIDQMGFVNWDSESYPAASDFIVVPIFALFFTSVRLFLDKYVFEKIARRLILGKKSTLADVRIHANQKKIGKFKESAWKCVYFLSAELFALSASYNEPWFTDTKYFWVGPGDQIWPDQKFKLKLKGLYMYGAGFYTYSIFALVFWETRRSDFLISMSHHVITVTLLVLSYVFRFARVGSIVLALHDATDVYLEIAKMSRYSGYELISSIFFVTFVIVWTILRIICYLFWILRSTSYEAVLVLDMEKHGVNGPLYYYIFNTLLSCIAVFNIYWWKLMVGMVLEQIRARGQVPDDVRSDSDGENEHDD